MSRSRSPFRRLQAAFRSKSSEEPDPCKKDKSRHQSRSSPKESKSSEELKSSKDAKPFTRDVLPPELRNSIYEEVLVAHEPVIVKTEAPFIHESKLLRAAKWIRGEAREMFWGMNTFKIKETIKIEDFAELTDPDKLKLIRSLYLEVGLSSDGKDGIYYAAIGYPHPRGLPRRLTQDEHEFWALMGTIYDKAEFTLQHLTEAGVSESAVYVPLPCPPQNRLHNQKIVLDDPCPSAGRRIHRQWVTLDDFKQFVPRKRTSLSGYGGQYVYDNGGEFVLEKVANSWPFP